MFNLNFGEQLFTLDETIHLIHETGYFYLTISFSFLLYFLFLLKKSSALQHVKKSQILLIFLWAAAGIILLMSNSKGVICCTFAVSVIAIRCMWCILKAGGVLGEITLTLPTLNPTLKSHRYFLELQKQKVPPEAIFSCMQINEFILWSLILYRSVITLNAAIFIYPL